MIQVLVAILEAVVSRIVSVVLRALLLQGAEPSLRP